MRKISRSEVSSKQEKRGATWHDDVNNDDVTAWQAAMWHTDLEI